MNNETVSSAVEADAIKQGLWDYWTKYLKSKRIYKRTLFANGRWLHKNSRMREGFAERRMQKVLGAFRTLKKAMTDREVADYFKQPVAFAQPRITEALQRGYLKEIGDKIDPKTQHQVRLCELTVEGLAS